MSIVYINGDFLPIEEATVSVMDRGFLFADGIYEVLTYQNGDFFAFDDHMRRLENSLAAIRLSVGFTTEKWRNMLETLVSKNEGDNQALYLQVTRGSDFPRMHGFPLDTKPTVFCYSRPYTLPSLAELKQGIAALTVEDARWKHCNIKSIALLPNVLHYQEALDAGAGEAILIKDGCAIEASHSNLFVVVDNGILTAPAKSQILDGVTRQVILSVAEDLNITVKEQAIPLEVLQRADEIWVSGSVSQIRPVIQLDDKAVGTGKAGPVWEKIFTAYQAYRENT